MRELIRQMIFDARRPPRTAADDASTGRDESSLGARSVRLAQLAAALHMSQAAPLVAAMHEDLETSNSSRDRQPLDHGLMSSEIEA